MNKKKALFTSLAALALAATANTSFAEEVDATVAEPVVAEVPATEEVAQELVVEIDAEVAPVAETVHETPALEVTAEEDPVAAASAEATPAVTTRAVEEAPAMDVQAIVNGDYSSAVGTYVNDQGETLTVDAQGAVITYADSGERVATKLTHSRSTEGLQDGVYTILDTPINATVHYLPAGSTAYFDSGSAVEPERTPVVATVDTIVADWGSTVPSQAVAWGASYKFDPTKSVYRRQVEPVVEEPVAEAPVSGVDTAAILLGDYSSIAGDWATGLETYYRITADGQVEYYNSVGLVNTSQLGLDIRGEAVAEPAILTENGYLVIRYYENELYVLPAGVVGDNALSTDASNSSQDRIVFSHGPRFSDAAAFAYRLPANQAIAVVPVTEEVALYGADYIDSVREFEGRLLDYTFLDIDNNGTPELIVSSHLGEDINGNPMIGSIHSIINGQATVLDVPGVTISSSTFITTSGDIVYARSSLGGEFGRVTIYRLNADNTGLVLVSDEKIPATELETYISGFERVDLSALTWYSDTTKTAVVTTDGTAPVVTQTAQPTTGDVVHVPLSVKADKPVHSTPSRSEKAQSEKGSLPNTGDAGSVLGLVGGLVSSLGLAGLRRRQK